MRSTSQSFMNRARRCWRSGAAAALVGLAAAGVQATVLSVSPAAQTVGLGAQARVDIVASDVLPGGLGNYDFDIVFDPAILGYSGFIDGAGLGLAIGLGATAGTGLVTLSDFSFELPDDLLALQGNSFTLLTLVFNTLGTGTSSLSFDRVNLADANFDTLAFSTHDGSITVEARQDLPEPGTLGLVLAAALVGIGLRRRRAASTEA